MDGRPGIDAWYDGSCALCRGARDWIRARDPDGAIAFHDAYVDGERAAAPVPLERLAGELIVVLPGGEVLGGAAAVSRILRELPGWSWLGRIGGWPLIRGATVPVYRWVARHRHARTGVDRGPGDGPAR